MSVLLNIRITFFGNRCITVGITEKTKSQLLCPTCMHEVNVHMQAELHRLIMTKRLQQTLTYQTLPIIYKLKLNCKPETPVQQRYSLFLCECMCILADHFCSVEMITFISTFSKLVGFVTSKQTRTRLASWYESGRSLS